MTALAVISALVTTLCIGYHLGRRAGSTRPFWKPRTSWKQRTSRAALGKRAIGLVLLITARRLRRSFPAQLPLAAAVGGWGLKFVEPLQLLRNGAPRRRLR
jgi:hypothetical protein